jgi:hypothetical protein
MVRETGSKKVFVTKWLEKEVTIMASVTRGSEKGFY